MRLTCPNCGARYEVDDSMIPAEGRDVQCSNCTTTWFQPGLRHQEGATEAEVPNPEPPIDAAAAPVEEDATESDTSPAEEVHAAAMEQDAAPFADEGADYPDVESIASDDDTGSEDLPRREIDPDVRDVLREEAEREADLRRSDAEALQRQGEMALDQLPDEPASPDLDATISDLVAQSKKDSEPEDEPAEQTDEERSAEASAAEQEIAAAAAAAATAAASSRRDLLPDIEEINSTLRANEDRSAQEELTSDIETLANRPNRRRGLRLGFAVVLLIFTGLILLYSNASQVVERFPQTAGFMQGYVQQVDGLRMWIDGIAQGALEGDADEDVGNADSEEEVTQTTAEDAAPTNEAQATEGEEAPVEVEAEASDAEASEASEETADTSDASPIETDEAGSDDAEN